MKKILASLVVLLASLAGVLPHAARADGGASVQSVVVYDTSAIISGKVLSPSITSVDVLYQGGTAASGEVTAPVNLTTGAFSAEIDGLSAQTTYHYNIADDTTSALLVGPLTFVTKNTIFGFTIGQITSGSANLSGTVTSASPDLTIEWGVFSNSSFDKTFQPTITSKDTFSENLVNMLPNTKYKVQLVKTSDPTVWLSGLYTFTTLPATALPTVSALGSTTATISATVSTGVTGASVFYGTSASSLSTTAAMTATGGTYSANLTGLTAATNYFYKIGGGSDSTATSAMYTPDVYGFTTLPASVTPPAVGTIVDTVTDATGPAIAAASTTGSTTGPVLVPCGGPGQPDCNFTYFIKMINILIGYLIFYIIPCIVTIVILYAGFLLLTSSGNEEKVTEAKGLITKAVLGIIIVTIAWLVVKGILVAIGYDNTLFPTFY